MTTTEYRSWEAIRVELLRRITARVWPPGALIPPEEKLAEEFGCARATVNRAMRELAESGLIERRRKAGTRVLLTPVRRATLDIPVTRLEIEGRGHAYRFALLEMRKTKAPALVASRLGVATSSKVLHLRTLHFADNHPFVYEDRWLNPAAVPACRDADFRTVSVNEWLVRHVPYTTGDIAFSAANASAVEAEHLGVAPGTALFIVERTTTNERGTITAVRLAYAPGYRVHTSL